MASMAQAFVSQAEVTSNPEQDPDVDITSPKTRETWLEKVKLESNNSQKVLAELYYKITHISTTSTGKTNTDSQAVYCTGTCSDMNRYV